MLGSEQEYGIVPATLGLEVKNDIPGIERSARLEWISSPVKVGENIFSAEISYVDPEFLEIFTFPLLLGDKKSIESQGNVLISRTMATKLFGDQNPIGKAILIINNRNMEFAFTVSAVFADLPQNSSFRIDIFSHFDNFLLMSKQNDADWKIWTDAFFILVKDKSILPSITQSLKNYLSVQNTAREDFRINRFALVPFKKVGANTRIIRASGLVPSLHPAAVIAPPIMAIFILLIACFNFTNTSIATFSKRLKEIGLRKTFGGQRKQLVAQFMFETLIICLLSLFVAIAFAEFLVPAYSSLWSYMSLKLTFTGYPFFWIFLLLLLMVTGFIAGVYPAIYVSSLSPVNVLKGASPIRGSGKLSSVLLALQFSISVMALTAGLVFSRNANYQRTLDLGYDRDKLIAMPIPPELFTSFRNEIIANPKISSAAGTQDHIGFGSDDKDRRSIKDIEKQLEVDVMDIGPEYASIMGLRLAEGRLFDKSRTEADRANKSIIVNQKMVRDFGWKAGVGMTVTQLDDTTKLTVIGVVKDFYIGGLWQKINPTMLRLSSNEQYGVLVVRAEPADLPGVLDYLSLRWKNLSTNLVFSGIFQQDTMQEGKTINNSIMKVNIFLAIAAMVLSLIGMYNLVSLDIIRRTKEMGIRKINGAPVSSILFLSSKKFLIVLVIASVLGCAGGYYLSLKMMDSIWDYFVEIRVGILLLSASTMFVATILTIIFKITGAAMKNPVVSLRYE